MTSVKKTTFLFLILFVVAAGQACKSKKALVQKPAPAEEPVKAVTPVEETKPEPVQQTAPPPPPVAPKADYNFSNIQFEFNSAVLKTGAYAILDKASLEMKKDPSVKFNLNGYASAEGSDEHNMALSKERAGAVKLYLVNSGVSGDILMDKGFGESNPITKETDEAHRAINRRVEIKKQ
jgi:OOP family OmpA-OmpF porin